jgi:hypothetical protein
MNSVFHKHRFAFLVAAAILVDFIPYVKLPFLWSETFFHEISHGLAALITGGRIVFITLDYVGSGLCMSQGGVPFVVVFSGYFGSALWGLFIYLAADRIKRKSAYIMMALLIIVLLTAMLFWAKGVSTYIILTIMIAMFSVFFKLASSVALKMLLQFIGMFVLLDAIRSPLVLIDGKAEGDGANLSSMTYVPEFVWVGIWFVFGLACLFMMFKYSYRINQSQRSSWL